MSSTLTLKDFTIRFINKCPIIRSTRLDRIFKALINNYSSKEDLEVVDYLNKIRIIYYLKRLEYKNNTLALKYKSKYLLYYLKSL